MDLALVRLRGVPPCSAPNSDPFAPLAELPRAVVDRVFAVNVQGVLNMTEAFLPHLRARPVAHIANVSSLGGLFAFPRQTAYGASKAAVKLLSEGLYQELKGTAVGVTVVFPGATRTDITRHNDAHTDALERLSQNHGQSTLPAQVEAFGIAGGMGQGLRKLFLSHPPLPERIAALRASTAA